MRKATARTHARKNGSRESDVRPVFTATSTNVLVDGSDAVLRELIRTLLDIGSQVHELRSFIAERVGVSEPQYKIILAIVHDRSGEGISIGDVAEHLWTSPNFVTMEVRKLHEKGWIEKFTNPDDRRGILLRLSKTGREAFLSAVGTIQQINDTMYGDLSAEELEYLTDQFGAILDHGKHAIARARVIGQIAKTPTEPQARQKK